MQLPNCAPVPNMALILGCGDKPIKGLTNCDLFSPLADVKIDTSNLSGFDDESVDYIETHHMIEHLSFEEGKQAFKEWSRVMAPGGYLVLTCPDLTEVAKLWIKRTIAANSKQSREDRDYVLKMIYGSQERPGMFHRSGYDATNLREILAEQDSTVIFSYTRSPIRPTPSLLIVAAKTQR